MDLYTETSYKLSRQLTLRYSTSFGYSTKLFDASIRDAIFSIYGLVRIADEVVDTYAKADSGAILDDLETETYRALKTGYSPNPIVHAFVTTARTYAITPPLIKPFFKSMRMDLFPKHYTEALYNQYIYGSAEVIGLMCLKVFCQGNEPAYKELEQGARRLGAAYQKVNFLRDIASDFTDRQRIYFPGVTIESFDEKTKQKIIKDIRSDFKAAKPALNKLPQNARRAVQLSYEYYEALLKKLEKTPAATIKQRRVRVPNARKLSIYGRSNLKQMRVLWQK